MNALTRLLIPALALLLAGLPVQAQFGKNKIAYDRFKWHIYHAPHFDVYYYPEEEKFLQEIVSYAESAYLKISKDLDHELKVRVPLIIYKTHGEFEQTNVTLAELPEGVGAFAEPVQYRMVLPIDEPPDKLYKLVAHELVHIFEYSMFFGGSLGRTLRARPPTWIMEGLASYLAEDEDSLDRMVIRDAVVNNILPPIQALNVVTFLTYRYGNAIFDYIEQEHGIEGLRSFLFEFKKVMLTGNVAKAIKESFGYDINEFNRRYNRYLRKKYFPVLLEKKSPDEYGTEIGVKQPGVFTFSPTLSPSGELVAALATPKQQVDLVVLSAEDGRQVKNLTKGYTNKYQYLTSEAFSGKRDVSWSPTEDRVAVFARKENGWPLLIFNAVNGKMLELIKIKGITQNASPAYSPDGRRVAFEGNKDGVVDIFEIDLETKEIRNLTQDDYFDANPWYAADGKSLLYNRRVGEHWKVFSVDLEDSTRKTQLTFGQVNDIQPSYSRDGTKIYFSSDRGSYDVFNIHELDLTTGEIKRYTDVVGGCFAPVEMAERDGEPYVVFQAYFEGTFRLYRMPIRQPIEPDEATEEAMVQGEDEEAEAEKFEPPVNLTIDDTQKRKYKTKWDIEAPGFGVGVADDGTILANGAVQFTDLLGDKRILVAASTVSSFASFRASYFNLKHRNNWGANIFDLQDFFYQSIGGALVKTEQRATGGNVFLEHPVSRYNRVSVSLGATRATTSQPFLDPNFQPGQNPIQFSRFEDTYVTADVSYIGDTTRWQSFGPFQGKRYNIGAFYGFQVDGTSPGDYLEYHLDFRAYKQLTRRSVLAWRLVSFYNAGDTQRTYGVGGLNQLRGFEFREFSGSQIAWQNLEFRFPLVDVMRFPVLDLGQIRGMVFLDIAATTFQNNVFYDPNLGTFRTGVPFKFWDSENNRLQDGRASWGWGFQFRFIGGLQFNFIWAYQLDYSQYIPSTDEFVKVDGESVNQFYIAFDW